MRKAFLVILPALLISIVSFALSNTASPAIPEADGFVIIPAAQHPPSKTRTYKAVWDATKFPNDSTLLLPALNNAGAELNALAVSKIPLSNAKFVIVFHGGALFGILDNEHYKAHYGIDNPNLKVLEELKKAGVKLFVCGQNLLAEKIDPKIISKDVTVASDALIVLMDYQNAGYALMSF
jgi:intracellular sulfur oxidation DsrE/DsrF family protein